MIVGKVAAATSRGAWCHREELEVYTESGIGFVDVTEAVAGVVERSGVRDGLLAVQSLHTTAAVVVNEGEPLLLEDLRAALERAAPRAMAYRHDDFDVRTVNLAPGEPANGHAHAKALFLRTAETLSVAGGRAHLGRWQRVFLVELDGPRRRALVLTVLGV
ncbi:MAG TPA: secondary thiamine-phosphate synthase enzyme YjbQ [Vicinamibacteria bacterium]|nr:secondary thiamine-phosphate synthase enzyme YjbQ [Vicinamibacteria bacterium]